MPITAFLSVSSKAAGFFILLNLVNGPFSEAVNFLLPLLGFVATFTIFFGNSGCLRPKKSQANAQSFPSGTRGLLVGCHNAPSMVFPEIVIVLFGYFSFICSFTWLHHFQFLRL